ncbi:MerR family transcriptional regulator [bacterium 210820-DFI.6.37]|nr:MerR family transcriptional regulator [bacterium 210820-DFI.6.37]
MTLEEVSRNYNIDTKKLILFEEKGLTGCRDKNGFFDFRADDIQRISLILALQDIGMDIGDIRHYLSLCPKGDKSIEGRIRLLRKQRYRLLEEIHEKQKVLDSLDFMIYKMKEEEKV